MNTPHYIRFARSLALLGAVGTVGCPETNSADDAANAPDAFSATDAPGPAVDAFSADDAPIVMADAFSADDAYAPTDAFDICATCTCAGFGAPEDAGVDAGAPDCFAVPGAEICCAAVGPLMPPDLAV